MAVGNRKLTPWGDASTPVMYTVMRPSGGPAGGMSAEAIGYSEARVHRPFADRIDAVRPFLCRAHHRGYRPRLTNRAGGSP
ncbi:hypothetical protein GCM10010233_62250 [Streptomyces pseudogriseolus]|nr:hypothetical protein GCM10010233_62250 [Streptomyces gancidicus]